MSTTQILRDELAKDLSALPMRHLALFAAGTSERLLPNYQAFSLVEGWGNYDALRSGLDHVWDLILKDALPDTDAASLKKRVRLCERQMPDADDFSSWYTGMAQDAFAAVLYTLKCITNGDFELVADFVWICTTTIESYLRRVNNPFLNISEKTPEIRRHFVGDWNSLDRIQRAIFWREENERMDQEFYKWIWTAPMMVLELNLIRDDVDFLRSMPRLDAEAIRAFREVAVNRGIRPVRRRLVKFTVRPAITSDEDQQQR